jgi:CubicO group peptidase (beta-lactamase class C family)
MPLLQFLREKVFTPLGMKSVADMDQAKLSETNPTGYLGGTSLSSIAA